MPLYSTACPLPLNRKIFRHKAPSAPFSPIDIAGISLWLKADAGVTVDGNDFVTAWADQSGNGNNCSSPNAVVLNSKDEAPNLPKNDMEEVNKKESDADEKSKDDKKELLKKEFNTSLEKSHNSELLTEKALRYDLTVPFARFVAMNRNELAFPFRRYQIQPVWRADRPQRGRYREFYQCDADIIGSDSLVNEAELIALFQSIFNSLNLRVNLYLNSRKILAGIVDTLGESARFVAFAVALDKLDKIGWENVAKELIQNGFTEEKTEEADVVGR